MNEVRLSDGDETADGRREKSLSDGRKENIRIYSSMMAQG